MWVRSPRAREALGSTSTARASVATACGFCFLLADTSPQYDCHTWRRNGPSHVLRLICCSLACLGMRTAVVQTDAGPPAVWGCWGKPASSVSLLFSWHRHVVHFSPTRCYFTIRKTQLHRSCESGFYLILLHVSAVHNSHHQVGHWFTQRVKKGEASPYKE